MWTAKVAMVYPAGWFLENPLKMKNEHGFYIKPIWFLMNISYNDLETYIAIIAIGYIYIHSHISPAIGEILKLCYVSVRVNYNELVDVTARQDLPRHDSSRLADTGEGDQVSDLK